MAYLSKKDWQKHLKLKEHSKVKKTGISDLLSEYEKAAGKKDNSGQVTALEKLQQKIDENKRKWSSVKTLTSYLDSMKKEARKQQDLISKALANSQDDTPAGKESDLAKALLLLKKNSSENKPHHFVVAPGNPSTGLIINRKKIKAKHIKEAHEIRGKGGPYFVGTCYCEANMYYFDFPEAPPSGLAKSFKLAARLHAEMAIKVTVRGGGVEYDDEADEKLGDAGETRVTQGGASAYPNAKSFDPLIAKIASMPVDKRGPASTGISGKIRQLMEQAMQDPELDASQKKSVLLELNTAADNLKAVTEPKPAPDRGKKSAYPSLQEWENLLEKCLRLDPDKRVPAVDALKKKLAETAKAIQADTELTPQDKKAEVVTLQTFSKSITEKGQEYIKAARTAKESGYTRRLKDLETEFDIARKQNVLPDEVQQDVAKAILATRKALATDDKNTIEDSLDTLEAKLKAATKVAFEENTRLDKNQKQARVLESVKQGVEVFKKGAFASGTADALFRDKGDLKIDKGLKKMGDDFRKCEKNPSPENLAALSKDGQAYLVNIARDKARLLPQADPNDPNAPADPRAQLSDKDAKKLAALEAQEKLARQAVQRVRLLELANEIESLGPPPWDDATNEHMAELQVSFFFEEGAIKQDVAEFGAPQLEGDDDNKGVNEAWWIKRIDSDADRKDKDGKTPATKTYIFKPQDLEAGNLPGIQDKGGSVREVLASRLNDQMSNFGFDVGVCPTHLVQIDSAKLGGLPATEDAKTFGAVQELGANKGPVSESLADPNFAKTLDHKNISDIAAFDLMFLSLDRHGKNLLVQEQEDGSNKLLPIDHGIGLPDPVGLALSRQRMTGNQNIVLDKDLRPDELMAEETRANLKRIDAKKMTQDMKAAQEASEKRHPATKGKMDPAEFDRMEHRIEFMKAAADSYTTREMTQAIANHAFEINRTDIKDMPKLAADLLKKIKAVNEGAKEVAVLTSEFSAKNTYTELQGLGWCNSMGANEIGAWVDDNGDLVARILKAKISNPAAEKEIRELLAELKDDALAQRIDKETIGNKLQILRGEVERRKDDEAFEERDKLPKDDKGRQKMIKSLGGDAKLAEAKKLFPDMQLETDQNGLETDRGKLEVLHDMAAFDKLGGASEYKLVMSYFGDPAPDPQSAVKYLESWRDINAMGGIKVYAEMGGVMSEDLQPKHVSQMFAEMKRMANSGDAEQIRNMDPATIEAEQIKTVNQKARTFAENLKKILVPKDKAKYTAIAREIAGAIKEKNWNLAQAKLEGSMNTLLGDVELETSREKEGDDQLKALKKVLDDIRKQDKSKDLSAYQSESDAIEKLIKEHDYYEAKKRLTRLDFELDDIVNGSESKKSKLEARAKAIADQISALGTDLGKERIAAEWKRLEDYKNNYDDEEFGKVAAKLEQYLGYIKNYHLLKTQAIKINWSNEEQQEIDKAMGTLDEQLNRFSDGSYNFYTKRLGELIGSKAA